MPQPFATKPSELPFIELKSVDSTNNYARQQIHAGLAQHGMAIFAHEQVAGKGQRGKVWTAEKGSTIALSILLKPQPLLISQQFQLSACVAVAVHDLFAKYAGDDTKIKWPNDLYWQDRKAGGILIESIVRSRESGVGRSEFDVRSSELEPSGWEWSIVGIGININQAAFPAELVNPVSLKQITGKNFEPSVLAKELYELLMRKFDELVNNGFEKIFEQYLFHLYKRGEKVKFKKDSRVFEATVKTISSSGKLVVEHSMEEEFGFGEVEWVIK